MKKSLIPCVLLAAGAFVQPMFSQGLPTCPPGYKTIISADGLSETCEAMFSINPVPEISASSSVGGIVVLLCGAFMLRRRRASAATNATL